MTVYSWKISRNKADEQLRISINYHVHQPEEFAAELRKKSICLTRKFWDKRQGYKYSTIHCPLNVGDSQETQERREISWLSPMWLFFSDKRDPPDSPTQVASTAWT
jgi:hypothetical protein